MHSPPRRSVGREPAKLAAWTMAQGLQRSGKRAVTDGAAEHVAAPPAGEDMQCLIVDDDLVGRKVLVQLLSALGYCETAGTGRAAVEAFRSALDQGCPYDLVCLDVRMPGVDGMEVLREIRSLEDAHGVLPGRGARIVMVTSVGDGDAVLSAFRNQCDAYTRKPVTRERLFAALQSAGIPTQRQTIPSVSSGAALLVDARAHLRDAVGGDDAFVAELLRDYVQISQASATKLRERLRARDVAGISHEAHSLKGASLNMGLREIGERSSELETLCRSGRLDGAADVIDSISALCAEFAAALAS
jgi:two-component system, chemotaxis family, chemotaxis protein CheY